MNLAVDNWSNQLAIKHNIGWPNPQQKHTVWEAPGKNLYILSMQKKVRQVKICTQKTNRNTRGLLSSL